MTYLALRALGIPACRMRIAQGGGAAHRAHHAVPVVGGAAGDAGWVLDNARAKLQSPIR